jgi:hypothetical protein
MKHPIARVPRSLIGMQVPPVRADAGNIAASAITDKAIAVNVLRAYREIVLKNVI